MPNYNQAPTLSNKKPKSDGNFIQIDNKLFSAIWNGVGKKYKAGALLTWLVGQSDGFKIPAKTVMDALGTNKNGYYAARQQLEDLGFITVSDGDFIKINYDVILKGTQKGDSMMSNHSEDSILKGTQKGDSIAEIEYSKEEPYILKGTQENDSILEKKMKSTQKEYSKGTQTEYSEGTQKEYYNIEEHRKTYNSNIVDFSKVSESPKSREFFNKTRFYNYRGMSPMTGKLLVDECGKAGWS